MGHFWKQKGEVLICVDTLGQLTETWNTLGKVGLTVRQCNFLLIHSLSNPHLIFHPHHLKILQHHNHMLPLCWSRAFAQGFFTHWNTLLPVLSLGYLINSSFIFQLRFLYWTPHFLFLQPNFKQRDAYFFLFSIHSTIHANLASLSSMKTVSDAPV